jgi:activator of HSP90 ATPase
MPVIQKIYEMNASPEEVFEALTNSELIQIWSGDEAKMSSAVGATFSLWGGQMYGVNLEVVKNKKLVQEWSYEQWALASKVTFNIKAKGKKTMLELIHEDVPEKSVNSISDGWDEYYLGSMKDMFEAVKK